MTVLEFDSEWFGAKIGRYDDDPVAADSWARINGLDCLYTLLPLKQVGSVYDATQLGFQITDVRVEFAVTPYEAPVFPVACDEDYERICEIARTSFRRTRFQNDKKFDQDRVSAMYEKWALSSAGTTLVVDHDRQVAGFVVVGATNLELIAVAEEQRGDGYGEDLTRSAIGLAHHRGLTDFRVVTQSGNHAAQRTFKAAGFKLVDTSLWLHKWYP